MSVEYLFIKAVKDLLDERQQHHEDLVLFGSLETLEDYKKHVGIVHEIKVLKQKYESIYNSHFNS